MLLNKSNKMKRIEATEQEIKELESTFESNSAKGLRKLFDKELESINRLIKDKLRENNVQEYCINLIVTNYKQEKTAKPVFLSTGGGFMIASKENS